MAANYGRPRPTDTLSYRRGYSLRVRCACGRTARIPIGELIARGVPGGMRIYQVIDRLRCSACGWRPNADVPHEGLDRRPE